MLQLEGLQVTAAEARQALIGLFCAAFDRLRETMKSLYWVPLLLFQIWDKYTKQQHITRQLHGGKSITILCAFETTKQGWR